MAPYQCPSATFNTCGGWTLVWKFYRETAKITGNNSLNWGNNINIANNGSENCSIENLSMCNANLKGSLFLYSNISQTLAVDMGTKEYFISAYTLDLYNLNNSIRWDLRTSYYGNVFIWKGGNHRYTYGSGDNYYVETNPGTTIFTSGGNADTNLWRATFIR